MTKNDFLSFCKNKYIYLDGATGSNLVKAGMPSGVCPEKWILEHREVLLTLQKKYVNAGTNILYAPTFGANRIKLAEYGLADKLQEMTKELVAISKEAAHGAENILVAGDLTMTGEQLEPVGRMKLEELITVYKEQIQALEAAGVDLLVVETMMSLAEARAALIAAKECTALPVMVTMTFEANGKTLFGTDACTAAVVLESLGACAVGANCSTGPAQMQEVISAMARVTEIPIIAKPNAGLPFLKEDGSTGYSMMAAEFAEEMKLLTERGASLLGGCCGTDPSYIKFLHDTTGTERTAQPERKQPGMRFLTSERKTVSFGLEDPFIIIGERINPTGKKQLQASLLEGSMDKVVELAEKQEQDGALILDVNMGMSGIDEKEFLLSAITELGSVTSLPLSIDSGSVEVMEAALRAYPGRALINSVSLEKEKFEKLLPLAAKYGAMFILLPLSDKGLPENLEEKKKIIHTIYERALSLGMRKEDLIVDGLVTTVGANKQAALEVLETIRYCKERGFATTCGLSNISFGMPQRSLVNSAFLALAIREGLTTAIANPSQELLTGCALATDLLLNKEDGALRYIEFANTRMETKLQIKATAGESRLTDQSSVQSAVHPASSDTLEGHDTLAEELYQTVLQGNRSKSALLTREALTEGREPDELLNQALLPAIQMVGEYFEKGKYFLPQLIASAEAMKNSIEILEPLLSKESDAPDMPVVVLATVEGDIHDIGKNLVALMLKNNGFQVIDLGKDVPKEKIIEAAKEHHAEIIGLSALMTTTMKKMKEVISYAKEQGISAKFMIGGAAITPDFAKEIGADGYSKDAAEAVKLAKSLHSTNLMC